MSRTLEDGKSRLLWVWVSGLFVGLVDYSEPLSHEQK